MGSKFVCSICGGFPEENADSASSDRDDPASSSPTPARKFLSSPRIVYRQHDAAYRSFTGFGFIFVGLGCFYFASKMENPTLLYLFGAVSIPVGFLVGFFRGTVVIDRHEKQVRKSWGWLGISFGRKSSPLAEFYSLTISKERVSHGSGTGWIRYNLHLRGQKKNYRLYSSDLVEKTRAEGEALASALNIALEESLGKEKKK